MNCLLGELYAERDRRLIPLELDLANTSEGKQAVLKYTPLLCMNHISHFRSEVAFLFHQFATKYKDAIISNKGEDIR